MRVLFFTVGGARAFQNLPEDVWELSSAQLGERYRTGAFTVVEYFQVIAREMKNPKQKNKKNKKIIEIKKMLKEKNISKELIE